MSCSITCLFTSIALLYVLYQVGTWVYETFIYKANLKKYQTKNNDAWAVVTGCTSGIGEAIAIQLAKQKFNIVLVSRSETKLKSIATTLQDAYKIQTKIIVSDASSIDLVQVNNVVNGIRDLNVTILINNVGVSTETVTYIHEITDSDIEGQINVNCLYSTRLTRAMVPQLKQQSHSAIVNISSMSVYMNPPLLSVYAATKAYNLTFSRCLYNELKSFNIDVTAITPGFVISNMSKMKKATFFVCTAEACAIASLNAIGLRETAGYIGHVLMKVFSKIMPNFILEKLTLNSMTKAYNHHKKKAAQNFTNETVNKQ